MIDKLRRNNQNYFVDDDFITPFTSVYELKIEPAGIDGYKKIKIYLTKEGSTNISFESEDEMVRQLNLYFDWLDKKQNKLKF